jgi:hypothetical protein
MYPNLYYVFEDLFGIKIGFLRFINSFGFFVAIAFLVAAALLSKELRRKSKEGLVSAYRTKACSRWPGYCRGTDHQFSAWIFVWV